MAAKINWHRPGTKLRACHLIIRCPIIIGCPFWICFFIISILTIILLFYMLLYLELFYVVIVFCAANVRNKLLINVVTPLTRSQYPVSQCCRHT